MTNKNRNKLYGIITTVVIHATAVVLLFVLCFKTPLPLPGEEGVEVNLGMYETSLQDQETTSQQVEETEEVEEENITFEDEEVPAIEEETEEVEEEDTVKEVEEEKPVVNQRAMFKAPVTKNADNDKQSDDNKDDMERGIPEGLKDNIPSLRPKYITPEEERIEARYRNLLSERASSEAIMVWTAPVTGSIFTMPISVHTHMHPS